MKNKHHHIELFQLTPYTNAGIFIASIQDQTLEKHPISKPHRDDHYLLMFAFKGTFQFRIDFEEVVLTAPFILKIEPGQVHQLIKSKHAVGWVVGMEAFILESEFQLYLETRLTSSLSLRSKHDFIKNIDTLLHLGNKLQADSHGIYTNKSILFLINSLFCLLMAETETPLKTAKSKDTRAYIIEQNFRKLLKANFKHWKSPSVYADTLSITVSHLNDTIKELTGHAVSIHIQNTSILEAKRLLYFTDTSIKEIGYEVGYNEPVYFGKLFKKITSLTPMQFRQQFRD